MRMPSSAMRVPVATTTGTKTSVKTYLAIAAVGGASFAAAMFMAAGQPPKVAIGPSPYTEDVVIVDGQDDVVALSFQMAARNSDVLVDTLIFDIMAEADGDFATIEGGIDAHDHIENCSLYQEGEPNAVGGPDTLTLGQMAFRNLGIQLSPNSMELFEVQCDFANTGDAHPAPYAFAFKMPNDTYLEAVDANNGNALPATHILVGANDAGFNTQPTAQVNMYEQGRLSLEIDPTTPASDIILPSAGDVVVGIWNLTARGEDINLEKITFELDVDSANNIASAELIVDNGSEQTNDSVALVNGQAIFRPDALAMRDQDTKLILLIDSTPSDQTPGGSGTSGERIKFSLNAIDAGTFEAVGMISGTTITDTDLAMKVGAAPFIYRYTKPTIVLSAVSPSGARVPGNLEQEALRFSVSANSAEDVIINGFAFKASTTDNASTGWNECTTGAANALTAADFSIFNLTTNPAASIDTDSDWLLADQSRVPCSATPADIGYVVVRFPVPQVVPASSTHTFSLYANMSGASAASDDVVRFDIPDTALDSNDTLINGIFWDDGSGQVIPGYLVDNLPVNGGTLVF